MGLRLRAGALRLTALGSPTVRCGGLRGPNGLHGVQCLLAFPGHAGRGSQATGWRPPPYSARVAHGALRRS
ncbi:MAG: hypothetical protein V3V01_02020, partial [Acidimicrobiales bacterium]